MTNPCTRTHEGALSTVIAVAMAMAMAVLSPATFARTKTPRVDSGTGCTSPSSVSVLSVGADKQTLSWSAAAAATNYDVVRGALSAFPVGPQDGDEACLGNILGTSTTDATVPAPGTGFWYLVRGENSCTSGAYGRTSEDFPRFTTTCRPVMPPDKDAFLYVAGQWVGNGNPPTGSITFDGIVLVKSGEEAMPIWLTKIDLATHLSVWATKIVEGQDADPGANLMGPFIASDRATGDVYVQIGDFRDNGVIGFGHPLRVYDSTSGTTVKATLTRTHDRQHFLLKYDKDGIYQWSRTFRFGTTQATGTGLGTDLYHQNVSVLPNGNIVVGVYAAMPQQGGPFTLSLNDETMGASNLATVGTFNDIGQAHAEGALVVLDPDGNFVASTLSEVTATGTTNGYADFAPIFQLSRYTANGIVSGMREFQTGGASITARLGGGTFTNTHTPASSESKAAPSKYDTSLGFLWTADDTEEPSGNLANGPDVHAIELGSDGSVYSVGVSGAAAPAQTTSRSAGWDEPAATVVHDSAFDTSQPYYNKRSSSGAIEWSKGFLPGTVIVRQVVNQRQIGDVAIVNGDPWIIGYERPGDVIKIDGLLDLDSHDTPGNGVRGWLTKLDPSTGAATSVSKIFCNRHEGYFCEGIDPWEANDVYGGLLRVIPLDRTRLAVGLHTIMASFFTEGSLVLGKGEGNESVLIAPIFTGVGAIAVYDEVSGGLYFMKVVPTQQEGSITRVVALAGSEL